MKTDIVKLTKQWIERFVIGLGLCPFASFPFNKNIIYYNVSVNSGMNNCLEDLKKVVLLMSETNASEMSNAFLIYDSSISFEFTLELKQRLDKYLRKNDFEEFLQSVVFHPEFQFADESFHNSGNFTNRSPFPMIHLLRIDEVANAIELTEDVEDIPQRNKEVLEKLNIKNISEVFKADFMDEIKQYI